MSSYLYTFTVVRVYVEGRLTQLRGDLTLSIHIAYLWIPNPVMFRKRGVYFDEDIKFRIFI